MKRLLIGIAVILLFPGTLSAATAAPSDGELLEELYAQCLRALIPSPAPGNSRELFTVQEGGITPSEVTLAASGAVLTALGYSITDSTRESAFTLTIRITDARCTVIKRGKEYERFLSLTLHVRGTDHSGGIIFARGCERTAHDRFPCAQRKSTDTARGFSPELNRIVLPSGPNYFRISSLLAISAALGYFAFIR